MKNYPVFVYGTLRPGGALHGMVEDVLQTKPIKASASGYHLWSNRSNTFPYMTKAMSETSGGVVVGELLVIPEGQELATVINMEQGAGYEAAVVPVTTDAGNEFNCIGFVLPNTYRYWLGEFIPDGDWLAYDDTLIQREGYVESFSAKRATPLVIET